MKKTILACVALGTLAGTAHAQSSVTLFGIIDEGIDMVSNNKGGHVYQAAGSVMQGNRFGLTGSENLGGGLKAVFMLENGFNGNTGGLSQNGLMFGRQAWVGLASPYGTVSFGRQYDSVFDYAAPFAAGQLGGGVYGAHPGDLDNSNIDYHANNSIKYASPTIGGFRFGGLYSLGGTPGNVTNNEIVSFGAAFNHGPVALGAAYLNARNPGTGMFSTAASSLPETLMTPIYSGFMSANTYQLIDVGGSYAFGPATLGATYSNAKFMNLGSNPMPTGAKGPAAGFSRGSTATFNDVQVNFQFQFSPTLRTLAAADYVTRNALAQANGTPVDRAKYLQYELALDYSLSKRTDVYVLGVYQRALGQDSTGGPAVAAITDTIAVSSNGKQFVARVGLRHKF
ncbi:porin [Burkholderia glumae]|uniref:Porin n=1 Tax=Burkholderia glumae TaxID=337 RepID=A0AAP9Y1P5_BURGL|nr:porin [Burkholderia glumae]ACR31309.1 Outer membrane porin, OmpC family [Burkholderia glumae BGR1]AJY63529.1 gram-negative porin family protein [Burkholderia glumae LMG 2196 = ATCC 33617]KHJ61628.1 porin [Burkholderia glumae]MCM2485538.1 porin [Burkholderia glumae]MCM2495944.1 porin [Burkholderia glumae]